MSIDPDPGLNVFYGGNGAGKTSILEALVVLSRGRSFRTNQASELFGSEGKNFTVFAETQSEEGKTLRLGLERSGRHWRARKDGAELKQLSQLTRVMPLVLMEPNSYLLVSGAPEVRRKYLDWGMFHVEQGFLGIYRKYSRILKQRNAALRLKKLDVIESIDDVFSGLGVQLTDARRTHAAALAARLGGLLAHLSPGLGGLAISYEQGWGGGTLKESLQAGLETDLKHGATGSGPHRADIAFVLDGAAARAVVSRGEQKLLAAALILSQAEILQAGGSDPIILLDDLASEFDKNHFQKVIGRTLEMGGQVWVTGTQTFEQPEAGALFHVERGKVQKMV